MDNRKLTAVPPGRIRTTEGQFKTFPITQEGMTGDIAIAWNATDSAELVRRWNTHPDLLSALKHVLATPAVNIDWQMVANTIRNAEQQS